MAIASAERENLRFPIDCLRLPPSHKTRAPHFPLALWDQQKLNNSFNIMLKSELSFCKTEGEVEMGLVD